MAADRSRYGDLVALPVPLRDGPSLPGTIELWRHRFPVSARAAAELRAQLRARIGSYVLPGARDFSSEVPVSPIRWEMTGPHDGGPGSP
jgi:hypothetical protein